MKVTKTGRLSKKSDLLIKRVMKMLVGIKRDENRCRILYFFGLKLNISLKRKKQLKLRRLIQEETKIFFRRYG